jgi:hypothetical protein
MNDATPTPEPDAMDEQPPKKSCAKKKGVCFLMALAVLIGGLALLHYCPWFIRAHSGMMGGDEAAQAQIEGLDRRVKALESRANASNASGASPSTAAPAAPEDAKADTAGAASLARVQGDLIALSAAMSALQTEVKATGVTAAETREASAAQIASVVAYMQLREAEAAGRPFIDELTLLRVAARSDSAMQTLAAKLDPYAAAGAPALAALRDELIAREPVVTVAVAKGAAQNWWQRILAELQGLVSVRPLHGGEGDALARLEASLGKGSAAALEAFKELPADAQHSLADWQARLEARQHVDEAVAAIAARFTALPTVKFP